MTFDSTNETRAHIEKVQKYLGLMIHDLTVRAERHDRSKLGPDEKPYFDEWSPRLREMTYNSDEYKAALAALKPALDHHYQVNSHHPEHFRNGVNGMTLLDLLEMFVDWKAATERHANGSLERSIRQNKERFKMSDQLAEIFENTRQAMGW